MKRIAFGDTEIAARETLCPYDDCPTCETRDLCPDCHPDTDSKIAPGAYWIRRVNTSVAAWLLATVVQDCEALKIRIYHELGSSSWVPLSDVRENYEFIRIPRPGEGGRA